MLESALKMVRIILLLILVAGAAWPAPAAKARTASPKSAVKAKKAPVKRPPRPRIKRSAAARRQFEASHPCPSTRRRNGSCPGYIIDHVVPLACGGADAPGNMQWQTLAAAKAKDKWERSGCRAAK